MSEFEEKILKILKEIDGKLDKIIGSGATTSEPVKIPKETMSDAIISDKKEPEIVAEDVEQLAAAEGRRVCPECGSTEFNHVEDKTQILHSMGGIKMYKKNYQCRKCGKIL